MHEHTFRAMSNSFSRRLRRASGRTTFCVELTPEVNMESTICFNISELRLVGCGDEAGFGVVARRAEYSLLSSGLHLRSHSSGISVILTSEANFWCVAINKYVSGI